MSGNHLLSLLGAQNLLDGSIQDTITAMLSSSSLINALSADALLAMLISQGLTTQSTLAALLGSLSFTDVFDALSSDELLALLFQEGLIQNATTITDLKNQRSEEHTSELQSQSNL